MKLKYSILLAVLALLILSACSKPAPAPQPVTTTSASRVTEDYSTKPSEVMIKSGIEYLSNIQCHVSSAREGSSPNEIGNQGLVSFTITNKASQELWLDHSDKSKPRLKVVINGISIPTLDTDCDQASIAAGASADCKGSLVPLQVGGTAATAHMSEKTNNVQVMVPGSTFKGTFNC